MSQRRKGGSRQPELLPRSKRPAIALPDNHPMVVLAIRRLPYREAEEQIRYYAPARYLCGLTETDWTPDFTTIQDFAQLLGEDGCRLINEAVVEQAVALGLADSKVAVADTTAQEAAIPHPNEMGLLGGFVGSIETAARKVGRGMKSFLGKVQGKLRAAKEQVRRYRLFAKSKTKAAKDRAEENSGTHHEENSGTHHGAPTTAPTTGTHHGEENSGTHHGAPTTGHPPRAPENSGTHHGTHHGAPTTAAELAAMRALAQAARNAPLVCGQTAIDAGGIGYQAWFMNGDGVYSRVRLGGEGDVSCQSLSPAGERVKAWLQTVTGMGSLGLQLPGRTCKARPCSGGEECFSVTYCRSVLDCSWCQGSSVCVEGPDGKRHCSIGDRPGCSDHTCSCFGNAICPGGAGDCREATGGALTCQYP
jgi:hypothetical protein